MNNNDVNITELVDQLQMEIDNQAPIQDTAIEVVPDVVPDLRDEEENLNLFEHTQEAIDIYAYNSKGVLRQIPDYHLVNRRLKAIPDWSDKPEFDIDNNSVLDVQKNSVSIITSEQMESVAYELTQLGYGVTGSGELKDGKLMFIELEHDDLPTLEIPGTQLVPKFWIGSSHDGTIAFKSTAKVVDTICLNTFMLNSRSFSLFTAKHTKYADVRLKEYERTIKDAKELFKQYYNAVELLASTPVTNPQPYFASVLKAEKKPRNRVVNGVTTQTEPRYSGRHDNQLTQLMESWLFGEGQRERGKNLWRAFSSVTDWADNSEATAKDREKASHIIGTRAMQKTRAFDLAFAIASNNQ
jgi:hypothetical protein